MFRFELVGPRDALGKLPKNKMPAVGRVSGSRWLVKSEKDKGIAQSSGNLRKFRANQS